ncbi:MAG: DinB family protein [Pyrinomonadaceae bacterium]
MANTQVQILLDFVDQAFDHRAWHGTNLKGSVKGLDVETASWRPSKDRHNIWELILHAAYWKYVARRRLLSEKRGSFPLQGSNFFTRPSKGHSDHAELRSDITLLIETHKTLRAAIAGLVDKDLAITPKGSATSNLALIMGIASHDLYHAGQIQLLKRLAKRV